MTPCDTNFDPWGRALEWCFGREVRQVGHLPRRRETGRIGLPDDAPPESTTKPQSAVVGDRSSMRGALGLGGRPHSRPTRVPDRGRHDPPEDRQDLWPTERLGTDLDTTGSNRIANRLGVALGIDDGIGRTELREAMDIAVAHEWFAVAHRPTDCRTIEIDGAGVHGVHLDSIEQRRITIQQGPNAT